MSHLYFKLYYAGLNNCRMSLDIGVGLAYLTGRTLAPYAVKAPWCSDPLLRKRDDYASRATVLDLFAVPVAVDRTHARARNIKVPGARRLLSTAVAESVLHIDAETSIECAEFEEFRNRREHVVTLDDAIQDDEDILVDVSTLGMYSHFFYGGESRRSELQHVLRKIRPRKPYRELACRIAGTLAPFNAVHIRRGDFPYAQLTPRAHGIGCREITRNLASRLDRHDRLVVCTDSSSNDAWFAPLRRHFRDVVFLDRLLLDSWRSEFRLLPFHDDSVLALITQLVAVRAEIFVGTMYSSFTALIQRWRGILGKAVEFLYCYSDWDPRLIPFQNCEFVPVQDGHYSWNRILYPVEPSVHSWFREWPEAFSRDAGGESAVIPDGGIVLRAAEAEVYGGEARYERSILHDNIGYWTNPADFVQWNFFANEPLFCRVEIRYACADACAGSVFRVAIDDEEVISAGVAATGGWTVFSSWQPLGALNLTAGEHTASVRITAMPGLAAMNLAGIRFIPIQAH